MNNEHYLNYIRSLPCIKCYANKILNTATEAHHENSSKEYFYYKRKFDYGALPLCSYHHTERHTKGKKSFWKGLNVYLIIISLIENYMHIRKIKICESIKNILESKAYYNFNEKESQEFIDKLANELDEENDNV